MLSIHLSGIPTLTVTGVQLDWQRSLKSLIGSDPPLVLPDGCQHEVGLLVGGEETLGPGGDTAATQPLPPTQGVELLQVQLCSSGEADEGGR